MVTKDYLDKTVQYVAQDALYTDPTIQESAR